MSLFATHSLDEYSTELQDKVEQAQINDWKIYDTRETEVVLVKRRRGSFFWHVVWAILTAWWTFGLVNVLYWLKCRYGDAEYLTLRETRTETTEDVE